MAAPPRRAGAEPRAEADATASTEEQRAVMKWRKKIREVDRLEELRATGVKLDQHQRDKLAKREQYEADLAVALAALECVKQELARKKAEEPPRTSSKGTGKGEEGSKGKGRKNNAESVVTILANNPALDRSLRQLLEDEEGPKKGSKGRAKGKDGEGSKGKEGKGSKSKGKPTVANQIDRFRGWLAREGLHSEKGHPPSSRPARP